MKTRKLRGYNRGMKFKDTLGTLIVHTPYSVRLPYRMDFESADGSFRQTKYCPNEGGKVEFDYPPSVLKTSVSETGQKARFFRR